MNKTLPSYPMSETGAQLGLDDFESFLPDGSLFRQGTMKDAQLHGLLREFDAEDTCRLISHFKDGLLDGLTQIFDASGMPVQKSHYKAGHADGLMEVFARGQCVLQQNYSAGVASGSCKTFDAAGLVSTLLNY